MPICMHVYRSYGLGKGGSNLKNTLSSWLDMVLESGFGLMCGAVKDLSTRFFPVIFSLIDNNQAIVSKVLCRDNA